MSIRRMGACAMLLMLGAARAHGWQAYNDLRWAPAEDPTNNITWYSWTNNTVGPTYQRSGELVDYATGAGVGVTLDVYSTITNGTWSFTNQGANATGGDATLFTGKVGCKGNLSNGGVTLTFTGLDPARLYTVALFANRDDSGYTNRWTQYTISDVDSFVNASSAGALVLTNATANDTTEYCSGWNRQKGYIAAFRNTDPGDDGDMVVTVAGGGQGTAAYYVNALMLEEESGDSGTLLELSRAMQAVFAWLLGLLVVGRGRLRRGLTRPAGSDRGQ